jgi:hypothetical protein
MQECIVNDNLQQFKHWHVSMVRKNRATSWALLLVPLLVTIMLIRLLTPLQLLFSDSWYLEWVVYIGVFGLGYILYSRSRTVRDYEWQRQKAMQSVKGHIRAEDRGVWETEVAVPTGLNEEGEAALSGQAGSLARERETAEIIESDDDSEINLLVEQDHVLKATRRVSGEDTYDYDAVESSSGTVRRKGPMDRLLDWFGSKIAQRKKSDSEVSESTHSQNADSQESKQYSDSQHVFGVETVSSTAPSSVPQPDPEPIPIDPQVAAIYGAGTESMESLASLATPASNSQPASYDPTGKGVVSSEYAINRCTECGFGNPAETRYCDQCGNSL